MATIIDGKKIAADVRAEIRDAVVSLKDKYGRAPGLATIIVGERKDSQTYVRMKRRACDEVGIKNFGAELPDTVDEAKLLSVVQDFAANNEVDGILVQLPLPSHIDEERVLGAVGLEKDVDGFDPVNIGKLAMKGRKRGFVPCTPKGCIELLDRMKIDIRGKDAVVLGRSNIVGIPVANLLVQRDATVTVVHSQTRDLQEKVKRADIVIAAVGRAEMVRGDWLKPGCVVIDVGINAVDDETAPRGYRLVGDVNFAEAKEVASAITPVPGGVGPMTIAMLLQNTLESAERRLSDKN